MQRGKTEMDKPKNYVLYRFPSTAELPIERLVLLLHISERIAYALSS